MQHALLTLVAALSLWAAALAQTAHDPRLEAQLREVFPGATAFSPKQANPPHFIAYSDASGAQTVAGYVFWTTELEPLERGYDGPIKVLVGMNTRGQITGVLVAEHREPYGYFSIDLPPFARQFSGKDIRDPFRLGSDVDAVSTATITVGSAVRGIRNSARRIARALLAPPEASQ